ncbi:MAG: hypothetical protein R6X25_12315 [Candidatus Krumholzibacteriia bacterium]
MPSNVLMFGWNRALVGRERMSSEHFAEFVGYLEGLQADGTIASHEIVLLEPHGGDLNGFFLVRGEPDRLDALVGSDEWSRHMIRALMHLDRSGAVRGYGGEAVMQRMQVWRDHLPG